MFNIEILCHNIHAISLSIPFISWAHCAQTHFISSHRMSFVYIHIPCRDALYQWRFCISAHSHAKYTYNRNQAFLAKLIFIKRFISMRCIWSASYLRWMLGSEMIRENRENVLTFENIAFSSVWTCHQNQYTEVNFI